MCCSVINSTWCHDFVHWVGGIISVTATIGVFNKHESEIDGLKHEVLVVTILDSELINNARLMWGYCKWVLWNTELWSNQSIKMFSILRMNLGLNLGFESWVWILGCLFVFRRASVVCWVVCVVSELDVARSLLDFSDWLAWVHVFVCLLHVCDARLPFSCGSWNRLTWLKAKMGR